MEFFSKRSRYWHFRPHFSPKDARNLYRHFYKGAKEAYLSEYNATVQIRNNIADFATLQEIFARKIYDTPLPFTPATILDAGANTGLATIFFKKKYPQSSIACLEIEDENFHLLQKHTSHLAGVSCIKKALYQKDTILDVVNPYQLSNSFIVVETDKPGDSSIKAVTVDTLMNEMGWNQLDLLKMDIEGAEKEVFEGDVAAWLPRTRAMMIETHDRVKKGCSRALFDAIRSYDFDLLTTTEGTLIFINNQ